MTIWYSSAAYLLVPWAILRLVWRGFRYRAYWHRWRERFGFIRPVAGRRVIWVHAVSVGEVRTSAPLVEALLDSYPDHRILLTTMTPSGSEQVRDLFGERVQHCYVPYDLPDAVRRFMERARPEFAVIVETEFWPNIFRACHQRGIPLLLVNVRVSSSSIRGYLRFPNFTRDMLAQASVMCAQSPMDIERLRRLQAPEGIIHLTGNLKFDVARPRRRLHYLRQHWGGDRPVWIAASTHQGEERMVLDVFGRLRDEIPDLLLVLVPRHPERFPTVERLCRRSGFSTVLRSDQRGALPKDTAILLGDTIGELCNLYTACDVAYVGGSLVPKGGQNPLEALAAGVPVLFGPHMFNFEQISALILERGAGRQVQNADELAESLLELFANEDVRRGIADAGQKVIRENTGALDRTLDHVQRALGHAEAPAPAPVAAGWQRSQTSLARLPHR